MRILFAWLVALSFLTACQLPIPGVPVPTPIPNVSPSMRTLTVPGPFTPLPSTVTPIARSRVSTTEANHRIEIALFDTSARTAVVADVGTTVPLVIAFRPYRDIAIQWTDGTSTRYSEPWLDAPGIEMRFCSGLQKTCALADSWIPFAKEQRVDVKVDWLGEREFGVTAQFRDAQGTQIPAGPGRTEMASNAMPIVGVLNDRTPIAAHPSPVQTIVAQTRAAFPVTGAVTVGTGPRMGGKAGSNIDIPVKFEANSPLAPVTEMRIKTGFAERCLAPENMNDAAWEPFSSSKTYSYRLAINWTSFGLHVQYRDAKANVSPVYCGVVAVEGNP